MYALVFESVRACACGVVGFAADLAALTLYSTPLCRIVRACVRGMSIFVAEKAAHRGVIITAASFFAASPVPGGPR